MPERRQPQATVTSNTASPTAEAVRLEQSRQRTPHWKRWGPYLSGARLGRPVFGGVELFQGDPCWHDLIPFHEYFHGDTGAGIGASHQTGWTALVAKLLQQGGTSTDPGAHHAPRHRL
jgi:hypothetical protein